MKSFSLKLHTRKIIFFFLVAQYAILSSSHENDPILAPILVRNVSDFCIFGTMRQFFIPSPNNVGIYDSRIV